MNKLQRDEIAEAISSQLLSVKKELEILKIALNPVATQCSKTDPQRAELMYAQELVYKNYAVTQKRYNRLVFRHKHVYNADFGVCMKCGDDIFFKRLQLLPETTYCIECANEREQ